MSRSGLALRVLLLLAATLGAITENVALVIFACFLLWRLDE